jgi:Fur family peroxide stress response transcriptional regulator
MNMGLDKDFLTNTLLMKGIRPSYQRIRVLECLFQENTHPSVDEIFNKLAPDIPTLSKATVYNTIHNFINMGMIRQVGIDTDELRYDRILTNHGHFRCEKCGEITDFPIDIDSSIVEELSGFQINERNVFFKGLCPNCLAQKPIK